MFDVMFDFLFKKERQMYETKIEKLENNYKERLIEKDEHINELESKIRGERVNDKYCCACNNSYVRCNYYGNVYGCLLNVPCKDFQLKESDK